MVAWGTWLNQPSLRTMTASISNALTTPELASNNSLHATMHSSEARPDLKEQHISRVSNGPYIRTSSILFNSQNSIQNRLKTIDPPVSHRALRKHPEIPALRRKLLGRHRIRYSTQDDLKPQGNHSVLRLCLTNPELTRYPRHSLWVLFRILT